MSRNAAMLRAVGALAQAEEQALDPLPALADSVQALADDADLDATTVFDPSWGRDRAANPVDWKLAAATQ